MAQTQLWITKQVANDNANDPLNFEDSAPEPIPHLSSPATRGSHGWLYRPLVKQNKWKTAKTAKPLDKCCGDPCVRKACPRTGRAAGLALCDQRHGKMCKRAMEYCYEARWCCRNDSDSPSKVFAPWTVVIGAVQHLVGLASWLWQCEPHQLQKYQYCPQKGFLASWPSNVLNKTCRYLGHRSNTEVDPAVIYHNCKLKLLEFSALIFQTNRRMKRMLGTNIQQDGAHTSNHCV